MANTTGGDKIQSHPTTLELQLRLPAAIPASSLIFYPGQAVMRDVNGNVIQCDDTVKGEFIGIFEDLVRPQVDPVDVVQNNGLLGDKMLTIKRPYTFTALIASAKAGDEGRKVYFQFNNQVSYSPGNNGNYAGTVFWVKDSTHVTVLAPWFERVLGQSGFRGFLAPTMSGATLTLTKFDVNRTFQCNPTAAQTIVLPAVATTSPGDRITFIKMNSPANQVTLQGAGTDNINGGNTSTSLGTGQFSKLTIESDGTQWYIVA